MQSQKDSGKSSCRVMKARKCRTKPPTLGSFDKGCVKRESKGRELTKCTMGPRGQEILWAESSQSLRN